MPNIIFCEAYYWLSDARSCQFIAFGITLLIPTCALAEIANIRSAGTKYFFIFNYYDVIW